MKNVLAIGIVFWILAFHVSSCTTFHSGSYDGGVTVSNGEYAYKRKVVFETHYTYTLGFGGNKEGFLMDRLREELYARAELSGSEELTNMLISSNTTYFLVFAKVKLRITGDVIDWNSDKFVSRTNSQSFHDSQELIGRIEKPKEQMAVFKGLLEEKENLSFRPFEKGHYPQIGEVVYYKHRDVFATVVGTTFRKYRISYFKGTASYYDSKRVWVYKNQIESIEEKHGFHVK
ncbi:DUF6567 family protein [Parvicella tangerina]|uniref:Uncharacterized protein n=1 Tax=Parvicella tangerina TaxID=2829795 RepID=A0A916JKS5_9FLAO|nr:hypothetical protein [Parvicella tangerina]CAG5079801.1 hypothetical protein CRYO30217_01073 [Parvicella tangerina]